MEYVIDYQFLPKGAKALVDIGQVQDIEIDEDGFGLLPNVGDYVDIPADRDRNRESFRGRVSRRGFRYVLGICNVQIVLAETDESDWTMYTPK